MIPKDCKRLIEVDFPIAVVSKHAAREKSIRHGHPSTLHLWWARRPLAACRAVLLGLLLPDPCDPHCPEAFKTKVRELLPKVQGVVGPNDEDLRRALLTFIGDFSAWEFSAHPTFLEVARGLVKTAHPDEPPLVVDPFAGGGSIPLEALRLGCEAFASDLNPVACLILKVMLEDIPRYGPQLAEELRLVGKEVKEAAEKELAEFYPLDPDGSRPIAYLWARTVRCEAPNCGAEIPLARSFWLCKKENRKRALQYKVVRPKGETPQVEFEVFEPKSDNDVPPGTVTRARATCLCCGAVLPPERVRAQLSAQRGGADVVFSEPRPQGSGSPRRIGGAKLLAVVTLKPGEQGRHYRLPMEQDYQAVWKAMKRLEAITNPSRDREGANIPPLADTRGSDLSPVPDEPTPEGGGSGAGRAFSVQKYGMLKWGDLFTARQKLALVTLVRLLNAHHRGAESTENKALSEAVRTAMAIVINRLADGNSALSSWLSSREEAKHVFARQALPMVWDFCEVFLLSDATRGYDGALDWVAKVVEAWPSSPCAQVHLADAAAHPLPDETAQVWFTDPPYYDAVPYADLSDFFFVWLKRALPGHPLLRDPFDPKNPLTPKTREAVQNERSETDDGKPKDKAFYEEAMARAFAEGRRILREDGVGAVVFAHKTTEGWEALLSGLIRGGWTITGSWPIATEMASRLRARESAALATSVHLVCRPRSEDAPVGDWAEVLRELPKRVGDWMERLQAEGIRGADLVFACIGPALEIFSRYSKVETAEGQEVQLPEFLEKVWEIVGRTALEQVLGTAEARARNSAAGALEEDARLTALFLWTLQSTNTEAEATSENGEEVEDDEEESEPQPSGSGQKKGGYTLIFDVVRRFAQPLGIHLDDWEGRIIETKKGVVRLLPVRERATQLFGKEGASAVADQLERSRGRTPQLSLFLEADRGAAPEIKSRGRGRRPHRSRDREGAEREVPSLTVGARKEATTLDRVHAAMLLQASGRTQALRALLAAELERGPDFLRLANALSALYPKESEEKRLLDAMLLAVPR